MQRRQRTVYLVTAAAMLALIGGYALAATTVTAGPGQSSNVTQTPTPTGLAFAQVSSEQLVVISSSMASAAAAGTPTSGAVAVAGTPSQLASCAAAPCAVQNYRSVPNAATAGDFGEQFGLAVAESSTYSAVGFDLAITVSITVGTTTSSVVVFAYLETPASTSGTALSIPVYLFVDLGTTTAPAVNSVSVVFNQCSSGTSCP